MRHFTLLLLFLAALPRPALAQDAGARQELRLRLRDAAGRPVTGVTVSLVRVYDGAPMGERVSGAAGELAWSLATGYEYEIVLPGHLRPHPELLHELGDMGLGHLAFRLGTAGAAPQPPITLGLVVAGADGRQAGNTLFWDRAPESPLPQPDVPAAGDRDTGDQDTGDEDVAVILRPVPAATEVAPAAGSSAGRGTAAAWLPWFLLLVAGGIVVAAWLWLRPALRGGVS